MSEAEALLVELEDLIRQINNTNSATTLDDGRPLTAAVAQRDVLAMRHGLLSGVADAGSAAGFGVR